VSSVMTTVGQGLTQQGLIYEAVAGNLDIITARHRSGCAQDTRYLAAEDGAKSIIRLIFFTKGTRTE